MSEVSFPKDKIRIVLLEGIHSSAVEIFEGAGYRAEVLPGAASELELKKILENCHILGIRSKTQITSKVLSAATNLLSIGCFCIGTNQVDLHNAEIGGVPVFNAPFSNTRSVAELVIGEIIMLARKGVSLSQHMHNGTWNKSAAGCYEVRGKTIGIVGYGHIGGQVGVLAEAFGNESSIS